MPDGSMFRLLTFGLLTVTAGAQTPVPQLNIHFDHPVKQVSQTLYGLMTEEINYSYDGGLYAELVRNRTFSDAGFGGIAHWYLIERGNATAAMEIDRTTGPSDALHTSLRVDVKQASPETPAGLYNEGFWGMAVAPNTTYQGSLYAKSDTDLGPITASLVSNETGAILATAPIAGVGEAWKQLTFTLKTGSNIKLSSDNHLALTMGRPGKLWLSLVSLFPPTYHDRKNGNRVDLMEKLAAMKPAFLRFPGGNYLEGDEIWQRYEFKTTIGPLVDRPTHPSPWMYRSSDGMGLLEFLEWCEDLHMDPVLAVYGGYSMHQQHINPGPNLEPYVDDALDELEYVTGDARSKWGAVRAKDGHPAPFTLHYVEVGNEDNFDRSGSYDGRYAQYYKAIKSKYPLLQIIATTPVKSMKPDMIDDHYYKRADEFYADVHHYDKIDRNGPKIFVGEWATREGSPTTNFSAALGDAAWMTGMERNSDLIQIAAYAPLFVNVNPGGMQWESDLIGYDAVSSYGSPSYYAQVMFAGALGKEIPDVTESDLPDRVFYSVTEDRPAGKVIVKLVNATSVAQAVLLTVDGTAGKGGQLSVTTLSAPSPTTTNTIERPKTIVPVEGKSTRVSSGFTHTAPAYSIQVLTLSLK